MTATMQPTSWEQNASAHADDRLVGPRGDWWYTGPVPEPGCAGVEPDGAISSLPMPDLSVCSRQDVLDYFDNSWALQETLFAGLQGAEAFYRPPEHGLRHPLIFYYGHPAVLYVNKLRVAGLRADAVDAHLEDILETGVDEMSWDDLSKNEMEWPSVTRVHEYRATVYRLVRGIVEATSFAPDLGRPVTMVDPAWAVFLAFEHDRIHLETSSVLIRELPIELVSRPTAWPGPAPSRRTGVDGKPAPGSVPANELTSVVGGRVRLGKPSSFPSFGWDNEYGQRSEQVADFDAARLLVSNGEYHEFVVDGGYRRPELWSSDGEQWRRFRNTKWPRWWIATGPTGLHAFRLRTTFDEIDMPWDWPVCVNYHEAKAFLAWRSERDGRAYRLPTEVEFRLLRALPEDMGPADDPVLSAGGPRLREDGINLNLAHGSEGPVDASPTTPQGVHDAAGNVWTWCEDVCHPYEGFEPHPYYEDFTVPCFDGQHQMILGGCFVSTGDQASVWGRYHFRPHFLQQTGIRAVAGVDRAAPAAQPADAGSSDTYGRRDVLDRYLLLHYGTPEETFEDRDHPLTPAHGYPRRIAELVTSEAERLGVTLDTVLELGCAVGGTAFALAERAGRVVGVDSSALFVETAGALAAGAAVEYDRPDQGETTTRLLARAHRTPGGVEFRQGDAADPASLGAVADDPVDGVVLANLLDRLGDPRACLSALAEDDRILRRGGLLLVATPWSWKTEYTPREHWIGGTAAGPRSEEALRELLGTSFELVRASDESAVLRDHRRHFEFLHADVTVWRKR